MGSMDVIVVGYPIINFELSAFNYQIIHIRRISLTPNPHPHSHIIGFRLSTSAWISKTLLQIRIIRIRIRIGSDAEIIHTTFIPSHSLEPRSCQARAVGCLQEARGSPARAVGHNSLQEALSSPVRAVGHNSLQEARNCQA
jgi:hypothetical protein